MPSSNEIYDKVRDILVDALGTDESEITPDATLMGDLGAESIDFLDIVFRLEKTFNVKIPRGELFPDNFAAADPNLTKDGVLTTAGVAELRKRLPHANIDKFAKDPKVENIQDLFTVGMIVKFMEAKLAAAKNEGAFMRWFWIDRFVEFSPGSHAKAVKNVTLAEEHLHDHFPGFPVMPGSLMLEGMAQTGGILLGQTSDFNEIVILAKVPNVTFHSWACPGDTLIYSAKLINVRPEGGVVECTAHVGERLVAEAEIVFSHLDRKSAGGFASIDQKNFVFSMGLLGILEVGKAGDGTKQGDPAASAG